MASYHLVLISVRPKIHNIANICRLESVGGSLGDILPDEDGRSFTDWNIKSPNSGHKHAIFMQDLPESLIANVPESLHT